VHREVDRQLTGLGVIATRCVVALFDPAIVAGDEELDVIVGSKAGELGEVFAPQPNAQRTWSVSPVVGCVEVT
jgi:hypothetical protein